MEVPQIQTRVFTIVRRGEFKEKGGCYIEKGSRWPGLILLTTADTKLEGVDQIKLHFRGSQIEKQVPKATILMRSRGQNEVSCPWPLLEEYGDGWVPGPTASNIP